MIIAMFTVIAVVFFFALIGAPIGLCIAAIRSRRQHICLRCRSIFRGNRPRQCPVCYSPNITPLNSPVAWTQ
jgi:hypothetical protein